MNKVKNKLVIVEYANQYAIQCGNNLVSYNDQIVLLDNNDRDNEFHRDNTSRSIEVFFNKELKKMYIVNVTSGEVLDVCDTTYYFFYEADEFTKEVCEFLIIEEPKKCFKSYCFKNGKILHLNKFPTTTDFRVILENRGLDFSEILDNINS